MAANKQLLISDSRGDSNRCTPCRGNLIHTPHMLSMPVLRSVSIHGNLSCSPYKSQMGPCTRKKSLYPKIVVTAIVLWDLILPPMRKLGLGERSFDQVVTQLHQFTGPISATCDQYVQYLLAGANPSVLNRHRRELQAWRCQFFTSHSPSFPTDGPPLSTSGPTGLRLTSQHKPSLKSRYEVVTYISRVVSIPLSFYQILWLCLVVLTTYNYDSNGKQVWRTDGGDQRGGEREPNQILLQELVYVPSSISKTKALE
jgi:hypothetical protein